jgi:proline dehydrogenase
MLDRAAKALFHAVAGNQRLKQLAAPYGMRRNGFARRFIAGETLEDAIAAVRAIEAAGMTATLHYLGGPVATMAEADRATRAHSALSEQIAASGISRNLSVSLLQLGLTVDRATCVDNLRRLLDAVTPHEFFVRLDMENHAYTQTTMDVFETIWQLGYRNAGIVLQARLRRSVADAERMNQLGARVRLVKGAFKEQTAVAHQTREEVDAAFVEIMKMLLTSGVGPAIATHDPAMIAATRAFASSRGTSPAQYEFQMLYGVTPDLQRSLTTEGFRVRVYVPFGREWFAYFMRRLGERPSNVRFVIRSLVRDG